MQSNLSQAEHRKGQFLVAASALLWGLAGVCVKSITWNFFSLMMTRSAISLIMCFIIRKSFRVSFTLRNVMGGLMMFLTGTLYMAAIKQTTAGTAIVLQYIAPILIFLYCVFFKHRKPKIAEIVITALVFSGIVLSFADNIEPQHIIGNLLGLASGFTYAAQILIMNDESSNAEDGTIIGNLFGVVFCLPFVFFDDGLTFTATNIIWVLILGVFQYGLANIFFAKGVQKVGEVECSLILTLEPVFNPIPVALLCDEMMGPKAIIGACIVILGIILYTLLPRFYTKKTT